jgi:hypothetical protein
VINKSWRLPDNEAKVEEVPLSAFIAVNADDLLVFCE